VVVPVVVRQLIRWPAAAGGGGGSGGISSPGTSSSSSCGVAGLAAVFRAAAAAAATGVAEIAEAMVDPGIVVTCTATERGRGRGRSVRVAVLLVLLVLLLLLLLVPVRHISWATTEALFRRLVAALLLLAPAELRNAGFLSVVFGPPAGGGPGRGLPTARTRLHCGGGRGRSATPPGQLLGGALLLAPVRRGR
jgi:hypothetical protein